MLTVLFIIAAIFFMGVLVFVHELGHFVMAKINGIGVDAFSIGFGKELFGFTIGETRYRISMIPFGGYCKMRGEESKDRAEGKPADPRAMYNRPPYARLLAVLGGPVFNYIFAILLLAGILFFGYKETRISSTVEVLQTDAAGKSTPASIAGLKTGDTIIEIDGQKVESYEDIPRLVALNIDKEMTMKYIRANTTNQTKITPHFNQKSGMGYIGVTLLYLPVIGDVKTNTPAHMAGLKKNDVIKSVNGKSITYFYELQNIIADKTNQEVTLLMERGKDQITQKITLQRFEGKGYLGVSPGKFITTERLLKAKDLPDAFVLGFKEGNKFLVDTWKGLAAMFKGKIDVQKNISGPVRIIGFTADIIQHTDFVTILRFMALISIALGFFNLLPLPGLDGGHVVFNLIETVTPFRIPEKFRIVVEYIGFVFIVGLSIIVLFNDVFNLFMGR